MSMLPCLPEGETFFSVYVIGMELRLYCLPDDALLQTLKKPPPLPSNEK